MHDLLDAAVARRSPLLTATNNVVRLIDGAGDGLPGIVLETFADRWLFSTTGGQMPDAVRDWAASSGRSCYWKRLDQHQKQSPFHLSGPEVSEPFLITEQGIWAEVSFQSGYSQGIFLDQRDNRKRVQERMADGTKLLNTFSYTGVFSVSGALAGAETTTLDLSQPYLDWAKRNFAHNGMDAAGHHFCKGDTFHWLRRFAKQRRLFDGIVLDPPTFSRDERGKVFRVEKHFGELAALASRVLAKNGWILCCTNFRGQSSQEFEKQILSSVPRRLRASQTPMPPDFRDAPYLKSLWLEA